VNPWNSPNTDGCDPESCDGIRVLGVHFSLGDDCIAVKSGKIYMGRKYKTPTQNMLVENCLMESGHGAVTVGSEIAGGVRNMTVRNCFFHNTDRGLRIKTRRGRGRDSVLDDITFENISMDHVLTPFAVNSFYFCDPDGKTDYVQSRNKYPVDDRTPEIGCLTFRNIDAVNTEYAAGYYLGLPEKPLSKLKRRRKTFKKALMAYGYSRDKAENICRLIAMNEFGNSYAFVCEHMFTFRGR
jgi:polygalacturonase